MLEHGLPSVTLVHKGNIMKFTEGGFKKWGYTAEREFPDHTFTEHKFRQIEAERGLEKAVEEYNLAIANGKVFIKDVIADAFLQNTLKPEEYARWLRLTSMVTIFRPVGGDGWRHRYRTVPISIITPDTPSLKRRTARLPILWGRGANPAPCCSRG